MAIQVGTIQWASNEIPEQVFVSEIGDMPYVLKDDGSPAYIHSGNIHYTNRQQEHHSRRFTLSRKAANRVKKMEFAGIADAKEKWKYTYRLGRAMERSPRSDFNEARKRFEDAFGWKDRTLTEGRNAFNRHRRAEYDPQQSTKELVRKGLEQHHSIWKDGYIHIVAGGYSYRAFVEEKGKHVPALLRNYSGLFVPISLYEEEYDPGDEFASPLLSSPIVLVEVTRYNARSWSRRSTGTFLCGRDDGQPWALRVEGKYSPSSCPRWNEETQSWINQKHPGLLQAALERVRPVGWKHYKVLVRQGDVWAMGKEKFSMARVNHTLTMTHERGEHPPIPLPVNYDWTFGRSRQYSPSSGWAGMD